MPSKSKRSRIQINAEILNHCKKPRSKTNVMYKTNLCHKVVSKYIKQLQKWSLLKMYRSEALYSTTDKGLVFLQRYAELKQLMVAKEVALIPSQFSRVPDNWDKFSAKYFG